MSENVATFAHSTIQIKEAPLNIFGIEIGGWDCMSLSSELQMQA